jgi:hypothetical protein
MTLVRHKISTTPFPLPEGEAWKLARLIGAIGTALA